MFCALVGRVEGVIEIWTSRVQKQSRVFNEELRVLVVRPVIGVGVDDQLRIRHVLLHDERVHRGYVHVVTAVHDEGWLHDRPQIVVGPLLPDAPLANRFDLGGRHLVVHFRIAPNLTKMRALQELPSRRLAGRGRTEFDREPDTLGRIVGVGAKEPPCSLGYQLHPLTAARTCAIYDQPANEIGRLQSDFLHDQAADREAKQVNLLQAQRLDKGDGVSAHLLERRRDLAGAAGDARVVEQDHFTVASEAIRHRRVPIIHGANVVLVEDDRHTAGFAESAIGEADSVSLYELCRRGLVSMNHYGRSLYHLVGTASDTSARAAFAQSMSFSTVGAPLSPIAPTTSPFTLMGNPPPHAATRASVGMPAKSDGSPWIKLKKSCVETPSRAVYALFCAISMVGIGAPSIRLKALRFPPSSRIATFSLTPISLAFATAASTIFCASSEETLCFFTTFAIGLPPLLDFYCVWIIRALRACVGSGNHSAIHRKIRPGNVRGLRTGDKRHQRSDLINAPVTIECCECLLRYRPFARGGIRIRVNRTRLDIVDCDAPASHLS